MIWGLLFALIGCTIAVAPLAAHGQVGTRLTLRLAVDAPGESPYTGEVLPAGSVVLVYQEAAIEAHTLSNLGYLSRSRLAERLQRDGAADVGIDSVDASGQTRFRYAHTATAGGLSRDPVITYVLARTPTGELYESYVNVGPRGFHPGFDAVVTGRMTMGPVPSSIEDTMRAAFDAVVSTHTAADEGGPTPDTTPPIATLNAPPGTDFNDDVPASERAESNSAPRVTAPPDSAPTQRASSPSSPVASEAPPSSSTGWWSWIGVGLGGVLLGLLGGYGVWGRQVDVWKRRYERAESNYHREQAARVVERLQRRDDRPTSSTASIPPPE